MSLEGFAQRLPAWGRQRASRQDNSKDRFVSGWPELGEESLRQQGMPWQPDSHRVPRRNPLPLWPHHHRRVRQSCLNNPGNVSRALCFNAGPAKVQQDKPILLPGHLDDCGWPLGQSLNGRVSQTPQEPRVALQCPLP